MKKQSSKITLKSDVGAYVQKSKKSAGKDLNQKKKSIAFKNRDQKMWDSFYDNKPQ